jgi:uncharacterized NAD-dependent epimerase/dehydratase family protein
LRASLLEAIGKGLSVVCGLHEFVSDDEELSAAARRQGVSIEEFRSESEGYARLSAELAASPSGDAGLSS